jgi:nitrous oxidase accessory protein
MLRRAQLGLTVAALVFPGGYARAETIAVPAGGDALRKAVAAAPAGTVLRLAAGIHAGPVTIERPLILDGEDGAVVQGTGEGKVITVSAPDVGIRHVTVRGSGASLFGMDSGIFLDKAAERAVVEDDRLDANLIGVYVWGAKDARVRHNSIRGRDDLRLAERGNGVQVWNAPGAIVEGNDIARVRDGIFTTTSRRNAFRDNRFSDLRFGVHYMYTNESEVSGNVSTGNHAGYAIMYSDRLTIRNNRSDGDRDHGFLFNFVNFSRIDGNAVVHGGDKCVFIFNANGNRFHDNWFEGCRIGIHFTAGSERNEIAGNAFVANRTQVMYVGTRNLDWSVAGRGNYWSDNPAFDLNGDGIADTAYRPNDVVDQVVWRYPAAKLLLNSPATQIVRWAQSQFPALHPGGVIDTAPLMTPPAVPARGEPSG